LKSIVLILYWVSVKSFFMQPAHAR
jgi:hypothetical protein